MMAGLLTYPILPPSHSAFDGTMALWQNRALLTKPGLQLRGQLPIFTGFPINSPHQSDALKPLSDVKVGAPCGLNK